MIGSIHPSALFNFHQVAESLDFTRCVRPNGTAYGTSGRCRKGVESPLQEQITQVTSLYKDLKDLRDQKLPWGEEEWRAEEINSKIYNVRKSALERSQELGSKGERSLEDFEDAYYKGFASSLSKQNLENEIGRQIYDLNTYKGDKTERERVKGIVKNLRTLIENHPDESRRAEESFRLDTLIGKVKLPKPGSFGQTAKAGAEALKGDMEGLKSAASILRRANSLETELRRLSKLEVEEKKPGWIRRKLRISSSIMKLAQKRGNAEARLNAKMEGIRKRLLESTLSEAEVERLAKRVTLTFEGTPKLQAKDTLDHTREFIRMFNGKGLIEVSDKDDKKPQLSRLVINPEVRAFATSNTGFITSNGSKKTLFHEVGHIVEGQRTWLSDFSIRWRDSRAFSKGKAEKTSESQRLIGGGGAPAVSPVYEGTQSGRKAPVYALDDMLPLRGKGYRKDEVAVIDNFVDPYMGKVYKDRFTEVVSMTIEHFSEPYLMSSLFKSHPDLFVLGVGLAST